MKPIIKISVTAVLSALLVLPVLAQDKFPDVAPLIPDTPAYHWIYKSGSELKSDGLLKNWRSPSEGFRWRRLNRNEFGLMVRAAWIEFRIQQHELNQQLTDILDLAPDPTQRTEVEGWLNLLDEWQKESFLPVFKEGAALLNRLIDEFEPELRKLGANVREMRSILPFKQFPDVPRNHQAYMDVLDLKANGILVGYPDGQFKGNLTTPSSSLPRPWGGWDGANRHPNPEWPAAQ